MNAQSADALDKVKRLYIGSFGTYNGADKLRRGLIRVLKKNGDFEVVSALDQADAILEGRGELWIRGYRSLSPRARKNSDSADPIYDGYLSTRLRGKLESILWSYFADPRRVTVHELERDLVDEVATRLKEEHHKGVTTAANVQNANDIAADVKGGGASFPSPIYQEWFKTFRALHPVWAFEYLATNSEQGVADLSAGTLSFAGSDIPPNALSDSVRANNNFFPSVGGAVVLVYNLPGFTGELRLTADVIAAIFSGNIRTWSDPKLVAINPSAALPSEPIQIFHRSSGSGTTYAFTDFLTKGSATWDKSIGAQARVPWKVGKGVSGNEELSKEIAANPYSLGYVEFIYAFDHHLSLASIRNQAGRFVRPDLLSIMAAANGAGDTSQDLGLSIVNSPQASAYPISTMTWIVVPRNLALEKKTATVSFLEWLLTSGQLQCAGLGYAPLPRNVLDRELGAVEKLR